MKKIILVFLLALGGYGTSAQEPLSATQVGFITKVGEVMPGFQVKMLDGSVLNSATLKGKVVLLDFWGAKCGGCLLEMKQFPEHILKPYGQREDFFLLPIESQGHSAEEIKAVAARMKFDFPLAYEDGQDIAGIFFNRAMGLPRTMIIDRNGKIVYQAFGYTKEEFGKLLGVLKKTIKEK